MLCGWILLQAHGRRTRQLTAASIHTPAGARGACAPRRCSNLTSSFSDCSFIHMRDKLQTFVHVQAIVEVSLP